MMLSQNLRFLRKSKGFTQADLAVKIGITRSLVGAYEEGRAEPRLATIQALCQLFNVSVDTLIDADLETGGEAKQWSGKALRVLPIAVDRETDRELVTIVPVKASAGYTLSYGDVDFIESMPRLSLPLPELPQDRSYRLFQIKGESMLPVPSGAYIISEYVEDWKSIKGEECYVLVTLDEGVVYKRVVNRLDEKKLLLKSDNAQFAPYEIDAEQVIEVWRARGYISLAVPDVEEIKLSVQQLGVLIQQLQKDVAQLKKDE